MAIQGLGNMSPDQLRFEVQRGAKLVQPEKQTPIGEGQEAFRFDGEYWNDELRSYRVSIPSRCVEEGAL